MRDEAKAPQEEQPTLDFDFPFFFSLPTFFLLNISYSLLVSLFHLRFFLSTSVNRYFSLRSNKPSTVLSDLAVALLRSCLCDANSTISMRDLTKSTICYITWSTNSRARFYHDIMQFLFFFCYFLSTRKSHEKYTIYLIRATKQFHSFFSRN